MHCTPSGPLLDSIVQIPEAHLNLGGDFFYQGFVIVAENKELPPERAENLGSKRFTASWNSIMSMWDVTNPTTNNAYLPGTILEQWKKLHEGETETSAKVRLVSNGDAVNNHGAN